MTIIIYLIGRSGSGKYTIAKHIDVLPEYRLQGVGKALIRYVINHFSLETLHAETDDEAIEFYRKFGFICQPFEKVHGKRYMCNYRL
jgi:GNAT superfamily N-acetyltransferase